MHPYVVLLLVAALVAAAAAGAILGRDPGHRAHRLTAAILGCAAVWSVLEVVWNSLADPAWVVRLIRLSSLAWMPLGVLLLDLLHEIVGDARLRARRFLPALYAVAAVSIGVYVTTPLGLAGVVPTGFGWGVRFGPLFPLLYLPPAALAGLCLAVILRDLVPQGASPGERRQGRFVLAAIAVPLVTASATDAVLPFFGIDVPRLGSTSMTLVGLVVAFGVHRHGYSLLAPSTFAPQIVATLRDGVALLRPDGRVRSANASLARICRCRPDALVGRSIDELLPELARHGDAELADLECQLHTPGGSRVPVSLSTAFLCDLRGDRVGRLLAVHDLSEVVALRSRVVMAGRLAAVGELAAGIAHEINNPLAFVRANLNQLGKDWQELGDSAADGGVGERRAALATEGRELIEESLEGVARVADIVQSVRGFADARGVVHERADVNALVRRTLEMARLHPRHRATVSLELGEVPPVRGEPRELQQAALDVLLAALELAEGSAALRVATAREGEDVVVRIEVAGRSLAPEILARLFDPLLAATAARTGSDLSLAQQILRAHGGGLEAASEPGRGVRFRIWLPTL